MATAEQMANSIHLEQHGVFALLWDAKDDLVRALLILNTVLSDIPKRALLLAPGGQLTYALRSLIESRVMFLENGEEAPEGAEQCTTFELWILFLQQASSQAVGPVLNGWRSSLRKAPGTILIIRHGDFEPFQRAAPDLASFIGPKIYNASNLLSLFSGNTKKRLSTELPTEWNTILDELPGVMPSRASIGDWIAGS